MRPLAIKTYAISSDDDLICEFDKMIDYLKGIEKRYKEKPGGVQFCVEDAIEALTDAKRLINIWQKYS